MAKGKLQLQREASAALMAPQLEAWQKEVALHPVSDEEPLSPLQVPMYISADFNSARVSDGIRIKHRAADGSQWVDPKKRVISNPMPGNPTPEVVASVGGRILFVGEWDDASGYTVMVGGNDGKIYGYAHLASASVTIGQKVRQLEPIGVVGKTGNAAGHPKGCLHYTVRERTFASIESLMQTVVERVEGGDTELKNYAKVWPVINGQKLYTGMVVQPASVVLAAKAQSAPLFRLPTPEQTEDAIQRLLEQAQSTAGNLLSKPAPPENLTPTNIAPAQNALSSGSTVSERAPNQR